MINDEREKNDKEKITIKFLRTNNNYNYICNIILHLLQFSSHSFASLTSTSHFYPSYSNNKLILAVLQILVILIK